MIKILLIGECMLELSNNVEQSSYHMSFGGDTLNTAIYLSRLGSNTYYATAVGDDIYTENILQSCADEKVDTSFIKKIKGRTTGLYAIQTDKTGERFFSFWRSNSPARELFELENWQEYSKQLENFDYIYLSLITIAIYSTTGRKRLKQLLINAKKKGAKIVLDNNYRPALWKNTEQANKAYSEFANIANILLPSFDDEEKLMAFASIDDAIKYYQNTNVDEVVFKKSTKLVVVLDNKNNMVKKINIQPIPAEKVIDTTSAGDSFAGGYLHSRINGQGIEQSVKNAHTLASNVIQHKGAIIDKSLMPKI